ncbi:MAG: MmgE/PrpD family protein, partial [Sulfolobales archaeon]
MSTRDLAYKIAEYISSIRYKDLDERTIDEVRKRILDSIGVAVGAFHEKPYEIARRIARESVSSR